MRVFYREMIHDYWKVTSKEKFIRGEERHSSDADDT